MTSGTLAFLPYLPYLPGLGPFRLPRPLLGQGTGGDPAIALGFMVLVAFLLAMALLDARVRTRGLRIAQDDAEATSPGGRRTLRAREGPTGGDGVSVESGARAGGLPLSGRALPGEALRWTLRALSLLVVVVAVVAALPEIREALPAVRDADPALLGIALALQVAVVATLSQVYRTSVRAVGGDVRHAQALEVSMGAFTLSRILPGGGAAGAVFAARRLTAFGLSGSVATMGVALEGLLAMLGLALVVAWGTGVSALRGNVPAPVAGVAVAVTVLLTLLLVASRQTLRSRRFRDGLFRLLGRLPRRFGDVDRWRRPVDELAADPPDLGRVAPVLAWSTVNWSLDVAALWLVFVAFGLWVPLGVVLLGFGAANLLTALPHTPGGLGVVETGMTATYVALGLPASTAILAVLAYRLIAYWLPVLAGVPMFLRGRRPSLPEGGLP